MGKGLQGAILRALRVEEHSATVITSNWITPNIIRITFRCDTLLNKEGEQPAAWVRMWFPQEDDPTQLYQRAYTLLDSHPDTGVFSIVFVIHSPLGPASSWAKQAQPGDTVSVQRLGGKGFSQPESPPRGYLFVGDPASWPAIKTIVDSLDHDVPIKIVMEQFHQEDTSLEFGDNPQVTIQWVITRADSRALLDALAEYDFHGWYCWITAETTATRLVKKYLELNFHHNRATLHSQAYWIRGKAMGTQTKIPKETQTPKPQPDSPAVIVDKQTEPSVLRPARTALILTGVVQTLLSITYIVPYILFAEVARRLIVGAEPAELTRLGMIGLIVLGINTTGTAALMLALHLYDARYSRQLRHRILQKLANLPLGWFKDRRSAEVKTIVQDDVAALHYIVTHVVSDLVSAIVTPVIILIYLFSVDWRLALALILPICLYVGFTTTQARADKEKISQVLRWSATIGGDTERYISGQAISRVFGNDATVDLPKQLDQMAKFVIDWQRGSLLPKVNSLVLTRPLTILTVLAVAGTILVITGSAPATHLIPFLILGPSFGGRLLSISYLANGLREGLYAKANLELVLTTSELATGIIASRETTEQPQQTGEITVSDLSFSYGSGTRALHDINLTIPAGSTLALVGPSGAGKSTLAALIARLWDPDSGAIYLDGVDLRALPEDELRKKIAVVLQDVQLVSGTIGDNIALGHPTATQKHITDAATAAYIHDFISSLPDGYDTVVHRNSLSGGQRQRIAIARALLGNPLAVILDEATAATDPESEWAVRQGLNSLLANRTKVVVAHRLHTIAHADQIAVLNHGRVVEIGTHRELIDTHGIYSELVAAAQQAVR